MLYWQVEEEGARKVYRRKTPRIRADQASTLGRTVIR